MVTRQFSKCGLGTPGEFTSSLARGGEGWSDFHYDTEALFGPCQLPIRTLKGETLKTQEGETTETLA